MGRRTELHHKDHGQQRWRDLRLERHADEARDRAVGMGPSGYKSVSVRHGTSRPVDLLFDFSNPYRMEIVMMMSALMMDASHTAQTLSACQATEVQADSPSIGMVTTFASSSELSEENMILVARHPPNLALVSLSLLARPTVEVRGQDEHLRGISIPRLKCMMAEGRTRTSMGMMIWRLHSRYAR